MVPVSTFARRSHKDFNERMHELSAVRAMASAKKGAVKNDAYGNFDSILVSPFLSKRKRPEA